MKKYLFQICCLFTFLTLSFSLITIGDKRAKLRIDVFLDLTQERSGIVMNNLIQSIEKTCIQVITNSIVYLKIYPILSTPSEKLSVLSNYLNYLEEISSSFDECQTCSIKKFLKMSYYFRKINKNYQSFIENGTIDSLQQILNNLDSISLEAIVNDKSLSYKYNSDMNMYNSIGLKSPLVSINSVNMNGIENVSDLEWIEIFKTNTLQENIKCEDSEEFINRLKYY
jgi:hypothetical protein